MNTPMFTAMTFGIILFGTITAYAIPADDLETDLMDLSLEQLMDIEVSVVSKKNESIYEAPGIVNTVSAEDIELFGDRNLHQLMRRQPSVYTRSSNIFSDNNAGFRGNLSTHSEQHTLILFNGRPMRDTAIGYNYPIYIAFPLQDVSNVEIIRGPGSVLYGTNAVTGVINLKTREIPEKPDFQISARGGSYAYYDATTSIGGRSNELGYVGTFHVLGQEGFDYEMFDASGTYGSDNSHKRSFSGMTHLKFREFTLDLFAADLDVFSIGVQPYWTNAYRASEIKRLFTNLGYRHPLNDQLDLELNMTLNLQEDSLTSPAPQKIGNNQVDLLGEVTLYAHPLDSLDVILGYLAEDRDNYAPDDDHFQSIVPYHHNPQSAYVQGDYQLTDWAKWTSGLQWHKSSQGDTGVVDRHGVILTPASHWGMKLLYGEAFRAPIGLEADLYDDPILVGNTNLTPERTATYDAQLFYHDETTYAAATYFYTTIDNWIIFDFSVAPPSYMNGGEQTFQGIELEAKRFLTPHWQLLGSFMHQDNETDSGLNPTVVPDDMAKLGTAYTCDWGSATLFCTYFGKPARAQSTLVVNPEPKDIALVSMNFNIDMTKRMGLKDGQAHMTFKVENLLDEEIFQPSLAYNPAPNSFPYGPGRMFFAGMQFRR